MVDHITPYTQRHQVGEDDWSNFKDMKSITWDLGGNRDEHWMQELMKCRGREQSIELQQSTHN